MLLKEYHCLSYVDRSPDASSAVKSQTISRFPWVRLQLSILFSSWSRLFADLESGIAEYRWAVGSKAGYDDVMPYTVTDEECAASDEDGNYLNLKDGHAYYISVVVMSRNMFFFTWPPK